MRFSNRSAGRAFQSRFDRDSGGFSGMSAPCFFAALILLASLTGRADTNLTLWYTQPATKWTEALPVGNGRLGAMVFGGATDERIQLNENSIWAGAPFPKAKGGPAVIAEARKLFFDGKPLEGEQLIQTGFLGSKVEPRSYQPLGDLRLAFAPAGE